MILEIKQNPLDRVIGYFSPERALKRLDARKKMALFGFDGAKSSRSRGNQPSFRAPESSQTQRDRIALMKIAQDLYDNFGFVKLITAKFATHVCPVKYQARTGDEEVDQQIEDYLEEWFNSCDITGRHSFYTLMDIAIQSQKREGDIGFQFVQARKNPLRIQAIESDRIGGLFNTGTTDTFFGGITVEPSTGRPISYEIYDRTNTGAYVNPRKVGAEFFVHYFDPMRSDQYRGITAFHAATNTLRDLYEILEDEKVAVKWASSFAGVITNELGADKSDYSFDETTQDPNGNTQKLETISNGRVEYLANGEKMEVFKNDRPSNTFQGFVQTLYQEAAMSFNIPLGYLMRMMNITGPSTRMDGVQAGRTFKRERRLLEFQATNPIKNRAIFDGIGRGKIKFTPKWWKGEWMYTPDTSIDYGRDSKAAIEELKVGATTLDEIYGEQGKDWKERTEQKAVEASFIKKMSEKYDVPVEMIQMLTPNGNPAQLGEEPEEVQPVQE